MELELATIEDIIAELKRRPNLVWVIAACPILNGVVQAKGDYASIGYPQGQRYLAEDVVEWVADRFAGDDD